MEAELGRLHISIDRLSDIVVGLQEGVKQQAERTQRLAEKQAVDFQTMLTMLHDNFAKLIERQDATFKNFTDRLDKLVERQDSHFRWLAGLVVAALSSGLALIKLH